MSGGGGAASSSVARGPVSSAPAPAPAKSKGQKKAAAKHVKIAWLLEARAPAATLGGPDGAAALQDALRAAARSAGLADVKLSDVTET